MRGDLPRDPDSGREDFVLMKNLEDAFIELDDALERAVAAGLALRQLRTSRIHEVWTPDIGSELEPLLKEMSDACHLLYQANETVELMNRERLNSAVSRDA